ncbi:scavenger receptor cysteine-rich domain-containing protein DMBT1-like [Rhinophrynus dorsalis]
MDGALITAYQLRMLVSSAQIHELLQILDAGPSCGGLLIQYSGVINSPNFPNSYPAQSNCTWDIRTFVGYYIELRFLNFDLEPSPSCIYDWVIIYDGIPGYSNQLGKICNSGNHTFVSSSNIIGIEFRSDSIVHHTGFLAEFSSFYGNNWPGYNFTDHWVTETASYSCGGVLTDRTGVLMSPNFPNLYPDNAFCSWEIRALPNHYVEISFLHLDLEIAGDCIYDSVTIYDGIPLNSQPLRKICTPVNITLKSSSNIMGVTFRTDSSVRRTGFEAVYRILRTDSSQTVHCGGILNENWGMLESPLYPFSHESADCVWYIQVSSGHVVQIYFNDLELENSPSCTSGFVSIYDGTPNDSPLLGRYCGTSYPHFTSSSNSLSVVYSSRGSNSSFVRGFRANYFAAYQGSQNVTLSCSSDYMEARISLLYLQSLGYSAQDVFLNSPQCRPQSYGNWLTFFIWYNECGTVKQGERDTISYLNTVHAYHAGQMIQRSKKLNLNIRCQMYQNTMVEAMYHADDTLETNVKQYGLYSASMSFYQYPDFLYPIYQSPYNVQLNQNLYFQATLHNSDPDLTLFVDTCVASPYSNDSVIQTYDLIRNGCIRDATYSTYPAPYSNQVRFGFSAFSFANQYSSSVYLQCKLTVCNRYDYRSRCSRGCIPSSRRRTVEPSHEQIRVSLGPIHISH